VSAKWRRSKKNPKRFRLLKTLKRIENKKTPQTLPIKNLKAKRHTRPSIYTVPKMYREREWKEPKPLIDILEENNEIIVVSEFAGFNRKDLKIHIKNQRLTLLAESLKRKYHKSLNLPSRVIPNSIHTACKNGVLEIRLKKIIKEKAADRIAGLENAA
jgi:HSP20 family molecular chaperone IbpA